MQNINKVLVKNRRSVFYSFVICLGLIFSLQLLNDFGLRYFLIASLFTAFVLIFEIYLDWRYATKVLRQIDMPSINVYNLWGNLLNHIFLPILLLFTTFGFIYFNKDNLVRYFTIVLVGVVNSILFINIRSYYEDKFNIESGTRYVFDAIKLFIFFFGVNLLLHFLVQFDLDIWLGAFGSAFLVIVLGGLLLYRKEQTDLIQLIYLVVSAFLVAVLFLLLHSMGMVLLGINVLSFLLFYFLLSILSHKIERTLSKNTLIEYLLILIIAFLLFLGIN